MDNKKIFIFGGIGVAVLISIIFMVFSGKPAEDRTEVYEKMNKMIDGIIGYDVTSIDDYSEIDVYLRAKKVLDKIDYFDLFEFECDDEFCYLEENKFKEEYLILFGKEVDFTLDTIDYEIASGCSSNRWAYDKELKSFKRNAIFIDGCDPFGQGYFILERFAKEVKGATEIHSKIAYQISRYEEEKDSTKCHLYKDARFEEEFVVLDYPCDDLEKREEILSIIKDNESELYSRVHTFKEENNLITIKSYSIK